ncbi:MAG: hypothetical protein HPY74_14485 [Firmicutes bacterium]|nr:hypothetical protein [Bacillota bacterium]
MAVGGALAYGITGKFSVYWFIVSLVGIYLIEIGKNAVNEVVDYKSGVDRYVSLEKSKEGEHYKLVDGVPQGIDAEKNKKEIGYSGEYAVLTQWDPKPEWFQIMAAQGPIS